MVMLIAPALLLVATVLATPASRCDVAHLADCSDTNVLVRSPTMTSAMKRFLGTHGADRVSYLYANGRLIEQIGTVLGGPPDDRRDLPDGGYLFTACRPHSCMEKGAVAFDGAGHINAIGVVNYHCGPGPKSCSDGPTLELFIRDDDAAARVSEQAITAWATATTAADAAVLKSHSFEGTIIHKLASRPGD